jgi:hypothetical protein
MIWYTKTAEHLLKQTALLVINLATSPLASLPGSTWAIKDEDELYVQGEEAADAVEDEFLDALECLLVRCYLV